jgi:hypothetical protein
MDDLQTALQNAFDTLGHAAEVAREEAARYLAGDMNVRAFPDLTGYAPASEAWHAYDTNTYDGAPDAGPQIVGHGATAVEALADYRAQFDAAQDTESEASCEIEDGDYHQYIWAVEETD